MKPNKPKHTQIAEKIPNSSWITRVDLVSHLKDNRSLVLLNDLTRGKPEKINDTLCPFNLIAFASSIIPPERE